LRGRVRAPGDKSISHRTLILAAMAQGVTEVEGLLEGDDVLRTAAAMRAFGAGVEQQGEGHWRIEGRGGFSEPADIVDCGNAGTGVRLIMGAAAGYELNVAFTGDASLRRRPMMRVMTPLTLMGAGFISRQGGRLPLSLKGGRLRGLTYRLPEPSAQVKSAVLLAGLNAEGPTEIIEPDEDGERRILLRPGQSLTAAAIRVPGDPSSAAFPIVAALITPGSEVTVEGVLLNPLRTGLFLTLKEMGADLKIANEREEGGELVGDVTARHSSMRGVDVPAERAPSMIDEYPILAAAAAFAEGQTVMRGLGELMVKESDRLALTSDGLTACGVGVERDGDVLTVIGCARGNHAVRGGAQITTHGDHRMAMAHLVLGLASEEPVSVDEPGMIATSFPGFVGLMTGLGAGIEAA
jgi:3-phosphoshikimate 1-carboxyvinyltransferase